MIDFLDVGIARFQPGTEPECAGAAVALRQAIVVVTRPHQLIVDLPTDNAFALPIAVGHLFGQLDREMTIDLVRIAHSPAPPELARGAIPPHGHDLGVLMSQPRRRRRRGRTEDHLHSDLITEVQEGIQPLPLVHALAPLHGGPGKVEDPDDFETGLLHQLQIPLPFGRVEHFRVI